MFQRGDAVEEGRKEEDGEGQACEKVDCEKVDCEGGSGKKRKKRKKRSRKQSCQTVHAHCITNSENGAGIRCCRKDLTSSCRVPAFRGLEKEAANRFLATQRRKRRQLVEKATTTQSHVPNEDEFWHQQYGNNQLE